MSFNTYKSFKLNHKPSSSNTHIDLHKQESTKYHLKLEQTKTTILPTLPPTFSLASKYKLNILDQGNLGSCVANSFAGIMNALYNINYSRIFCYFNASICEGNSVGEDNGLDALQALTTFKEYGYVPEENWPYNTNNFSLFPPLSSTYKISDLSKNFVYTAIPQNAQAIKVALYNNNFIMCGINVYSSFMSDAVAINGLIPMPNVSTETSEGGHCIHLVGWCNINNILYFIGRNSWGVSWGNDGSPIFVSKFNFINNGTNGGFFYIPSMYITNPNLAFEFIAIGLTPPHP